MTATMRTDPVSDFKSRVLMPDENQQDLILPWPEIILFNYRFRHDFISFSTEG